MFILFIDTKAVSGNNPLSQSSSHDLRFIKKINNKSKKLNKRIQHAKKKYLRKIEKDELKLQKNLCKLNPDLADYFFKYSLGANLKMKKLDEGLAEKNHFLMQATRAKKVVTTEDNSAEYFPTLDSLETTLDFYEELNQKELGKKIISQLFEARKNINEAKKSLTEVEGIQKNLRRRKIQFKTALKKYPELSHELMEYDKSIYYFREQLKEYKNIFKEPSIIQSRVLNKLNKNENFARFFEKNNELARIFFVPKNGFVDGCDQTLNFAGVKDEISDLQKTEKLMQLSADALGPLANEVIESNMAKMHTKMNMLRSNFKDLSNAGDIPEFNPNPLKTKFFYDRIEYGLDFQVAQSTLLLPISGQIGLSIGYKLTASFISGITTFYRVGFGDGRKKIEWITNGWSYGAFTEHRLKGVLNLYTSFEKDFYTDINYRNNELNRSVWKNSVLAGLKLKIKGKKKYTYNMTLLYDFLHDQKLPLTPSLVYRMGFNF